ncbi:WXG100 family type VII secretion target [Amycolatopsis lurida]
MAEDDTELLNSPHVSDATKKKLEQTALDPLSGLAGDVTYKEVRELAVREMNNGRKVEESTAKAHGDLSAQQPPGAKGAGVAKSDEVLDLAKPALDFFSTWIDQVWNNVPGASRLEYMPAIWDRFHENRGIDFRKFTDEAEEYGKAREVVEQTMEGARAELNTLFGDWEGAGAAAARTKYEEGIVPDSQKLLDQLEGAATLIPETITAIYETLKQQVDEVLLLSRATIAGADVETAAKIARVAPGGSDSNEADRLDAVRFFDRQWGSNLESGLNELSVTYVVADELIPQYCETWLTSFKAEFEPLLQAFQDLCDKTNKTVDGQWYALAEFMSDYTNEFTDAAAPAATPQQQSGPPPGGTGPAMTGGGPPAMPAGGTGGAPSMPSPPPPPAAPPVPAAPEAAAAPVTDAAPDAASEAAEKNPVTGGELELDPETGEAYPIDPLTGEAVKEPGGAALTVEKGENKLSLSEPDADGNMAITVEGPSGEPKDYQLAFDGEGTEGDGIFRPGEDGKVLVEDGPLKITAERPDGLDGQTVVEVDDGSGEPTRYVLGEQHEEAAAQPAAAAPLAAAPAAAPPAPAAESAGAPSPAAPAPAPAPDPADLLLPAEAGGQPEAGGQSTAPQSVGAGDFLSSGAAAVGLGEPALGDTASVPGAAPSGIGLGSAPGGAAPQQPAASSPGSQDSAAAASMGMMGGMGGGAGGGNAGDVERAPNQYRHSGNLFDTPAPANRISGSLDDDDDGLIGFGR